MSRVDIPPVRKIEHDKAIKAEVARKSGLPLSTLYRWEKSRPLVVAMLMRAYELEGRLAKLRSAFEADTPK